MRHRKWKLGSGEALERGGRLCCSLFTCAPPTTATATARPHCFRMLNARTSALPALYIQHGRIHCTYEHTPSHHCHYACYYCRVTHGAGKGHLFSGDTGTLTMACPRNNARVLNLSIGGVARAQNSPSSSQLSNTGIHSSLKIPLLPPFLKDLSCSRNSLTCAGGARPIFIHTILHYTYNYTTLLILTQDTGAP